MWTKTQHVRAHHHPTAHPARLHTRRSLRPVHGYHGHFCCRWVSYVSTIFTTSKRNFDPTTHLHSTTSHSSSRATEIINYCPRQQDEVRWKPPRRGQCHSLVDRNCLYDDANGRVGFDLPVIFRHCRGAGPVVLVLVDDLFSPSPPTPTILILVLVPGGTPPSTSCTFATPIPIQLQGCLSHGHSWIWCR